MSGGVDTAVAALRAADGEAVAVTLELWRDPENDGERSCCSADAVRVAPARSPTAWASRTSRSTCATSSAPGVVDPWLAEPRRRPDAEPVRALQRPRAPRRDARLRRPPRRRDADHRPLRAPHARRPAAPGRRPGQGPELHARRAVAARRSRGCASRSATSTQGRGPRRSRARAGLPVAQQARLAGPLLPRRHRARARSSPATAACASARATSSTAPGSVVGRHRGHHHFTVGQRRGLGIGGADEPLYVLRDRRAREHRDGRAARRRCDHDRPRARRRACTPTPAEVDAVKLRYRAPAVPCRLRRRHARRSASPSTAPRPARSRSCCAGTSSSDAPQSLA